MIRKLFSPRVSHPLADPKEVRRRVAGLPLDNAFDAIDRVSGWLQALGRAGDMPLDPHFEALRQLDEAAQPHLRRLAREYLNLSRPSASEEGRLWETNHDYWRLVADLYARCIERFLEEPKDKAQEFLRTNLPLVSARLVAARAAQLKWLAYHYAPSNAALWGDIGRAYLVADALDCAEEPLRLYPEQLVLRTVAQQYLQALVLQASSIDCLVPLEIELADRLIEHLLPAFVLSAESGADSVYWVDAASGIPPLRLVRQPAEMTASMRFFSPGRAPQVVDELIGKVTRGEVPEDLDLGRPSAARQLLPVLGHLARYWAAQPPQREHPRHFVKNRCAIVHGFRDCYATLTGGDANDTEESWEVENVSFGGFGAEVDCSQSNWPKLGALLCVQPEGGANWILGVVRRYGRRNDALARVGIQSLSRRAAGVKLHLHSSGRAAASGFPGIWLRDGGAAGEARIVLPPNTFNAGQSLEFAPDNRRTALSPIALDESGSDYQIGRYREQPLA